LLTEQSWALISESVADDDIQWMESLGIGVENLDRLYEHAFLVLTTYTERQEMMLKLKYSHDKLIRLTPRV
jgi:hypothetical protein